MLTGATGYIGGRMIGPLEKQPVRLRCLARSPEKLRSQLSKQSEIVAGDVLDRKSLRCRARRRGHGVLFNSWPLGFEEF